MDARALAARIVTEVNARGRSLTAALGAQLQHSRGGRDRAFAQQLAYGVLRWQPQLDFVLGRLLRRPLTRQDAEILSLMRVGLFQLMHQDTGPHAAVSATVEAVRTLRKPWARGLINATLRGYLRQTDSLQAAVAQDPVASTAHPSWLLQALQQAWPDAWQQIVDADNAQAPMTLRVNARTDSREAYLEELAAQGIGAVSAAYTTHGVTLERATDVRQLPGFAQGHVSVQDAAAQLSASLLDLHPAQRVLDACAAPGGKTAQILETERGLEAMVAVERDPGRLAVLRDTLQRLRLEAELVQADAADTDSWWDGTAFDRVLLDAPCSATGVIRRHPDIKVLRRDEDIPRLAAEQARLLDALWPLLRSGGKLLYVTCSVLPRENHQQIRAFLQRHGDARLLEITGAWGRDTGVGRQILPGESRMDGFFYSALAKV